MKNMSNNNLDDDIEPKQTSNLFYTNRLGRIDIREVDPRIKEAFTQEWKNRGWQPHELFEKMWDAYMKYRPQIIEEIRQKAIKQLDEMMDGE